MTRVVQTRPTAERRLASSFPVQANLVKAPRRRRGELGSKPEERDQFMNECDQYLEECDLCHDLFDIQQIIVTECGQILCHKCLGSSVVERKPEELRVSGSIPFQGANLRLHSHEHLFEKIKPVKVWLGSQFRY
jgi:hypothetical protein